jgi:uncharacterized OB-fold protein
LLTGERTGVDYDEWVDRERRIRVKLLTSSPIIRETGLYRVCQDCGEICLCHEEPCPNCNSDHIAQEKLQDIEREILSGKRIRCRYRFEHLA